jgi:hypothetical protein
MDGTPGRIFGQDEVRCCENDLMHTQWPDFMNDEILKFFERFSS